MSAAWCLRTIIWYQGWYHQLAPVAGAAMYTNTYVHIASFTYGHAWKECVVAQAGTCKPLGNPLCSAADDGFFYVALAQQHSYPGRWRVRSNQYVLLHTERPGQRLSAFPNNMVMDIFAKEINVRQTSSPLLVATNGICHAQFGLIHRWGFWTILSVEETQHNLSVYYLTNKHSWDWFVIGFDLKICVIQ